MTLNRAVGSAQVLPSIAASIHDGRVGTARTGAWRRMRGHLVPVGLRSLLLIYAALMSVAKILRLPKRGANQAGCDILLTGTFYSENWIKSHLYPLALSERCARIRMVASTPVPPMEKVEPIYPPWWLVSVVGAVPARLLTFAFVGLFTRPHIVGGFHLLVNGLMASLVARLTGARSVYFCVGGPMELLGGGIWAENRLFGQLDRPDPWIERRLIQAVGNFDLVVTMGRSPIRFFEKHGVRSAFHVVSGGIDGERFRSGPEARTIDLVLVGRLVPIKRVDLFVETVKCVQRAIPNVTARIIGDGPLRSQLEELSRTLGVQGNVSFMGWQGSVEVWLRRSRLFVLTSDSEGLSLSLLEAMLCGLPAVVSNVGDLKDVVEDGVNGYLVSERAPEAFAVRIIELLADADHLQRCSAVARRSAMRYEVGAVSRLWDHVLAEPDRGQVTVGRSYQRVKL